MPVPDTLQSRSESTDGVPTLDVPTSLFCEVAGRRSRAGPYVLGERIGKGGLGVVHRACLADGTGNDVAVKLLRSGEDATASERRSFLHEIAAAARLQHAGLLPILDAGEQDGCPWFAMPLVRGGSLERALRLGRPAVDEAARLIAAIARAVHHAHQRGILHRDLKPANVLMGDDGEPLVADFGLARFVDSGSACTVTGQLMGSIPYMSPEQASGLSHRVGPATDVWSMGVMLYEMLAGQRPFQGRSEAEILDRIRQARFRPLREADPAMPAGLEAIVACCLMRLPSSRYGSAADLAADLERWRSGESPRALEESTLLGSGLPVPATMARPLSMFLLPVLLFLGVAGFAPPRQDDPVARIKALTAGAKPGKPVALWSANSVPVWQRVAMGGELARVTIQPGRPGILSTPGLLLLELLPPDPARGPYRLVLEARQTTGGNFSRVGLYAGHAEKQTPTGPVHAYADAGFAEPGFRIPFPNNADLPPDSFLSGRVLHRHADGLPTGRFNRSDFSLPVAPPPLAKHWPPWRSLVLEVAAKAVKAGTAPAIANRTWEDYGFRVEIMKRAMPVLAGLPSPHGPDQAAGLLVVDATLEVRRVVYEPLPAAIRGNNP